jgi:hypothetical protein
MSTGGMNTGGTGRPGGPGGFGAGGTSSGDCDEVRLSLGAYVLGALDSADRGRVDAHVASCDECRTELASFAALPGLLGRVSAEEVERVPVPPGPIPLQRLLCAVADERRHRRRLRWAGAGAAAAVVVAAASVTGVALSSSGRSPAPALTASSTATDPVTHVRAWVGEWSKAWGTDVEVRVSGVGSYTGNCRLVAVGADGTTQVAATWAPTTSGTIDASGAIAFPTSDIARFDIVTTDGVKLVSVPGPAATT